LELDGEAAAVTEAPALVDSEAAAVGSVYRWGTGGRWIKKYQVLMGLVVDLKVRTGEREQLM
jgi:hypothetical protein